jgi:hypothetical protein
MKIRNLSTVKIPTALWRAIAAEFQLDGKLPQAIADELGIYDKTKSLIVTVRPRRHVASGEVVTSGSYTYGRIALFPCTICTANFLTQVFVHELVHAWLDQYHPKLYWSSCDLAERFADAAFIALGGTIRPRRVCGSYHLQTRTAWQNLSRFQELVRSLIKRKSGSVKKWMPPRREIKKSSIDV